MEDLEFRDKVVFFMKNLLLLVANQLINYQLLKMKLILING